MSGLKRILANPALRTLGSALLGLLGYGAWAWFANMSHGQDAALRAALTQGAYSFVITMVLTSIMEVAYAKSARLSKRGRFLISTLPVCALLYVTSWYVNFLAGTPYILLTILPGAVFSTLYTFAYIKALERAGFNASS